MAEMQCVAGWPSASVQEERLAVFVLVQDLVEVPMREEKAASQPTMGFVASNALKALENGIVYQFSRPFPISDG